MIIYYSTNNTHIVNSYKMSNKRDMLKEINHIRYTRIKNNLPISRSNKSYLREWIAHNRLYKLGLFKNHTTDVDFEEPIKWYYELIYFILGGI